MLQYCTSYRKKIIEHICSPYFLREGVAQLLLQNGASYVLPTAITFIVHALFWSSFRNIMVLRCGSSWGIDAKVEAAILKQ